MTGIGSLFDPGGTYAIIQGDEEYIREQEYLLLGPSGLLVEQSLMHLARISDIEYQSYSPLTMKTFAQWITMLLAASTATSALPSIETPILKRQNSSCTEITQRVPW